MRKLRFLLSGLVAMSMGFAGCSSDELEGAGSQTETQEIGKPISFRAKYADEINKRIAYGNPDGAAGTQTTVDWVMGDEIAIYSPIGGYMNSPQLGYYTADQSGENSAFTYVEDSGTGLEVSLSSMKADQSQSFYAFYPTDHTKFDITAGGVDMSFTVPATQNLEPAATPSSTAKDGTRNVLLYAAAEDQELEDADEELAVDLTFNQIVTVLALDIEENPKRVIKTITVAPKTPVSNKPIAGAFTKVVPGGIAVPNPATAEGFAGYTAPAAPAGNKVTANLKAEGGGDFKGGKVYISIAPYEYEDLIVTLTDENGYTRSFERGAVTPRKLYKLPVDAATLWDREVGLPPISNIPANSTYMGIWVINTDTGGGRMTRWIGKLNDEGEFVTAWEIETNGNIILGNCKVGIVDAQESFYSAVETYGKNPTPLFYATGNLAISNGAPWGAGENGIPAGMGFISTSNDVKFGENTSNEGYFNRGNHIQVSISGTSLDIAHTSLSAVNTNTGSKWRMPTVHELGFLMYAVAGTTTNNLFQWAHNGTMSGMFPASLRSGTWSNTYSDAKITLPGATYLGTTYPNLVIPASGSKTTQQGQAGMYLTGTTNFSDRSSNLLMQFTYLNYWSNSFVTETGIALPIRPVSE